jgi:nicotinamide-nucleotide amidase
MAENNKRQAYLIEGAEALPNPNGSAPGQWLVRGPERYIALLPGPPKEMKPLYTAQILPRLQALMPPQHIRVLTFPWASLTWTRWWRRFIRNTRIRSRRY